MARAKHTTPDEPQTSAVETGTALALPDTPVLIAAYGDQASMDAILTRIETEVRAQAPDLTTVTGRKAIASLAFKVARSKTALDDVGASLIEEARRQVDAVNAKRRDVRERLDALKVEARAPLDQWEAEEAARVAALEDRLRDFTDDLPGPDAPSAAIAEVIGEIDAIPVDATWQEFETRAAAAKQGTLNVLRDLLAKAKVREAERAELDRLRAESAARDAADQRRLAQERATAEAARIERERTEAVERAAQAERDRAARQAAETEARHARELAAAKAREEAAAARERERIVVEQAKADSERRAREADQARRAAVDLAIRDALVEGVELFAPGTPFDPALDWETALGHAVDLIMAGRIPHVKVEM